MFLLKMTSFILSVFPLFMGILSLPVLLFQTIFSKKELDTEERFIARGKRKAWFYGLWLPTIIWTISFVVYKFWTYTFLIGVSLIEPLDYCGGIFFTIFYLLFHWGYSSHAKNQNLKEYSSYNEEYVFKAVFSILLFFVLGLFCSLFYLLIKLRS